jgi:hypothetical protein
MKQWPLSLRIFLIHTALVVIALLLMMSPLGHKPGAIHPVLVLPFCYLLFSGFMYIIVLIRGICELFKGSGGVGSGVAVGSSLLVLAAMGYGVAHNWSAWMSV